MPSQGIIKSLMDLWFYFLLHRESSEEEAIEELASCNLLYPSLLEDAETGNKALCAAADPSLFPTSWKHIVSYVPIEQTEINWGQQWDTFSPYFQDGLAQIPLSDFLPDSKETLTLLPGPGFGDLSHPTTRLSLKLLAEIATNQILIDLGCGSGILGLAALKWGARFVYAIDIDPEALNHTLENAIENGLENQIRLSSSLPDPLQDMPTLLVMNMTFGEQKEVLEPLSFFPDVWITSGILEEKKEAYLLWAERYGLKLRSFLVQDGWIACLFEKKVHLKAPL